MCFERGEQRFRKHIKFKTNNGCGIVLLARFQRGCWALVTINNTEKNITKKNVNDRPRPIARPA